MLANDAGGVFVDRLTAEREGKKLDVRLLLHVTIRGGQIVEGVGLLSPRARLRCVLVLTEGDEASECCFLTRDRPFLLRRHL